MAASIPNKFWRRSESSGRWAGTWGIYHWFFPLKLLHAINTAKMFCLKARQINVWAIKNFILSVERPSVSKHFLSLAFTKALFTEKVLRLWLFKIKNSLNSSLFFYWRTLLTGDQGKNFQMLILWKRVIDLLLCGEVGTLWHTYKGTFARWRRCWFLNSSFFGFFVVTISQLKMKIIKEKKRKKVQ